jgi:hypothetical protein
MISPDELAQPDAPPESKGSGRRASLAIGLGIFTSLAVGSAVVAYSFHLGAESGASASMFATFWAGMLLALAPLFILGTASRTAPWLRIMAVVGVAAVTTLPKLIRTPFGPLFHDEYAHLRQVNDVISEGVPGGFNSIVTSAPYFPGLHYLTGWASQATGASPWTVGLVIIALAHIGGLASLYWLARNLGLSPRGATVAAMVYATNANWMYFHAQFSYESLGLPLALVTLALTTWTLMRFPQRRWVTILALIPLGYVVATVHHLSALSMLGLMLAMSISTTLLSHSRSLVAATWAALTMLTLGVMARLWPVGGLLADYLGSPITRGADQLESAVRELLGLQTEPAEAVVLFGNSIVPGYERLAGFLVIPIFALAVVLFATLWIQQRRLDVPRFTIPEGAPMRAGLMWVGIFYFLSLPFLLAPGGNEGGRRSWAYSIIGLSILIGLLVEALSSGRKDGRLGWPTALAGNLAWVVLLVGGVATGVNAEYRFPLPPAGVSDLTAASAETRALGEWFRTNTRPNTWVLADRYSTMTVAGEGGAQVVPASPPLPYWEIYFSQEPPSLRTLASLYAIGAEYLIVDLRMASVTPGNGYWIAPTEPRPDSGSFSATQESLQRLEAFPWLSAVYASQNYVVYRMDLDRFNPFDESGEMG